MNDDALFESKLRSLALLHRGKVRDNYAIGDDRLLIVASDRLSAFDVVLPDPIPGKGRVLTAISNFWFARTRHIVANHLTGEPIATVRRRSGRTRAARGPRGRRAPPQAAAGRGRRARLPDRLRLEGLPGERPRCAASRCRRARSRRRGCRRRSSRPRPRRRRASTTRTCPSRRSRRRSAGRRPPRVRELALALYAFAADYARGRGILIADTKFEFGLDARRRGRADGRGADAGLVALLAGRQLPRGRRARPPSTSSTSATTSRPSTGTSARRVRGCRPRSSHGDRWRSTARPSAG